MDLISACALRVAKVVWRPGPGGFAFTVVCKATFELQPDVSPLAAAQEPVVEADVLAGDAAGLALASELVPFKKRPEVLVMGHAYAPEGRPAASLVARLAAGEIDKAIQVVGDRSFGPEGRLDEPARFLRMPLVWERAAGGPGTSNPAGRPLGANARPDLSGRVPAPNLMPAGLVLKSRSDVVPPVGFGPIAPTWPSRAACVQRHAAWWDPSRWQERPLPADIDLAYFNAAPLDQQRVQPFGGEAISLDHLHPRHAHLSTRLAPVVPAATVDHGAGPQPLQLRCDTLVIDTDRGLAMLVWRAHVVIDHPDRPGHVVVTRLPAPQAALPAWVSNVSDIEATLPPVGLVSSSAALPFSGAAAPPPDEALEGTLVGGRVLVSAVLPFASVDGEGAPVRRSLAVGVDSGLPFLPALAGEEGPEDTPGPAPVAHAPARPFVSVPVMPVSLDEAGDDPPTARRPGSPVPPPFRAAEPSWASVGGSEGADAPPRDLPRGGEPPVPPPLLGAIAPVSEEAPETIDTERRQPTAVGAADGAAAPIAEPEPEVALEAYPPERCGSIAARLACEEAAAGDVLRAEDLDDARWKRVHEHWLDRIRDEAARGRKGPMSAYDGAYVSALEGKRGPIELEAYARLAEAAERGVVAAVLRDLGLPEGGWPHIHRVWIGRMVKDVRLSKQVRRAIDGQREAGPASTSVTT